MSRAVLLFLMLLTLPLFADGPATWIVVPDPAATSGQVLTDKDILDAGGIILERDYGLVYVRMSTESAATLRSHTGVKYLQPVGAAPPPPVPDAPSRRPAASQTPPTWSSGTYVYDGAGNISSIGTAGDGTATTYTYDPFSRLKNVQVSQASSQASVRNEAYGYDAYGNMMEYRFNSTGAMTSIPLDTSSNNNRLSTAIASYDLAGSIVAYGGATYTRDALNMIVTNVHDGATDLNVYDAADERIGSRAGGYWTWSFRGSDDRVLRQFRSPASSPLAPWLWVEDYVYAGGQLVAAERPAEEGGRRHFHLDHLDSPRLVTTADGYLFSQHDYTAFGLESTSRSLTSMRQEVAVGMDREEPMRFTGHERDFVGGMATENENALDYMHARFYLGTMARFMSVDPAISMAAARSPQRWNRYSYVGNNPINRTDPTGMCEQPTNGQQCTAEVTLSPPKEAANWTPEQRAAENAKNAYRAQLAEEGKLVVTRTQTRPSSAQLAKVNGGPAPAGSHLDHSQELVLNGPPLAKENIGTLDAKVNTSNGARVRNAVAGLAEGTVITRFSYTVLNAGGLYFTIRQMFSFHTFLQNQEKAHKGRISQSDMERWVVMGDTRASPAPCWACPF
jgi:RHS repeat-associated protein